MPLHPEKINIVILGATGRVGRLVSAALNRISQTDICVWQQRRRAALEPQLHDFIWNFTKDGEGLNRLLDRGSNVHALINLAGVTPCSGATSMDENTPIAIASLKRAAEFGIPHVFLASSAAVYGVPSAGHCFNETDTPCPTSAYGIAKIEMERAASKFARTRAPKVTFLRIANVAGADELLCNGISASPANPLRLDQFSDDTTPMRSYIGPETLARVLLTLVRASHAGESIPNILNVASPDPVTMVSLLTALKAEGHDVPFRCVPAPKNAIPSVVLATKELEIIHKFNLLDSKAKIMVQQWLSCKGAT